MNPAEVNSTGWADLRTTQLVFLKTWPEDQRVPQHHNILVDLMSISEHWKNSQGTAKSSTLVVSKYVMSPHLIFKSSNLENIFSKTT